MALNRWLAQRSEVELRRIVEEPMLWPGKYEDSEGHHCLIGAACAKDRSGNILTMVDESIEGFAPRREKSPQGCWAVMAGYLDVPSRFDGLCARFGHVRITRLIQESALRHLARLAEQHSPEVSHVS